MAAATLHRKCHVVVVCPTTDTKIWTLSESSTNTCIVLVVSTQPCVVNEAHLDGFSKLRDRLEQTRHQRHTAIPTAQLQGDSKWSSSIHAMNDRAPSQPPSRCRMSVGSSNVAVQEESNVSEEAHRPGSAFGRLQQDSEWSSSKQAMIGLKPVLASLYSRRGYRSCNSSYCYTLTRQLTFLCGMKSSLLQAAQ
jgi:hypothetical protein